MPERKNIPDEKFIELHNAGLRPAQIAKALGIERSAVSYRNKKLGLTPNKPQKAAPLPPVSVQQPAPAQEPASNGVAPSTRMGEVSLGSATEDLLHDLDRSRQEIANTGLTERQRVAAFKDVATALKTIEAISKARLAVHDGWAQECIKVFISFAQRAETALARISEPSGSVTMNDVMDVFHDESVRAKNAAQEYYMKETEGLHR